MQEKVRFSPGPGGQAGAPAPLQRPLSRSPGQEAGGRGKRHLGWGCGWGCPGDSRS